MSSPRVSTSPEAILARTADDEREHPRFRLLIIGRSGTGKSSLVKAVFGPALANAIQKQAGTANINQEITVGCNKGIIIHYFEDNPEKFDIMARFIMKRSQKSEHASERLHAIWFCVDVPLTDNKLFEESDETIFMLNRYKVPIIVVFTKFDLFVAKLGRSSTGIGKTDQKSGEEVFKERYDRAFAKSTKEASDQIIYALVTIAQPETLYRLVKITMQSVDAHNSSLSRGLSWVKNLFFNRTRDNDRFARLCEESSNLSQTLLAAAHGANAQAKIAASVKMVMQKHWDAIGSSIPLLRGSVPDCICAIHKDIIALWNTQYLEKFLLSDAFCHRMVGIVEDLGHPKLIDTNTAKITPAVVGPAKRTTRILCLIAYVVDLTIILQSIFQALLANQREEEISVDRIYEIIYEFHCSEKKQRIHKAIWTYAEAQHSLSKYDVADKIHSLIRENEATRNDTKFDLKRPPLQSLLTIIRFERAVGGPVVNKAILRLVHKVLALPVYHSIISNIPEMDHLDVEGLLDFILSLLSNNSLSASRNQDVRRRARRLIFKLMSKTNIIPRSLYITDIKTDLDFGTVDVGGHGVFKGEREGLPVTLMLLDNGPKNDLNSTIKSFWRKALAWKSLSHRFILPLLGIFEEKSRLFLVSPYMQNGTLNRWRMGRPPSVEPFIHRLMLEVAKGIQYVHSEGIVHGDLKGENILLDSELHCQVVGFQSIRHADAIATELTAFSVHFAAPELFRICSICNRCLCDVGCVGGNNIGGKRTIETDVYSFGCLYYATFFDVVPFQGRVPYDISRLVTQGQRPERLENPRMEDKTWELIQNCWKTNPSERLTMRQVVESLLMLSSSPETHLSLSVIPASLLATSTPPSPIDVPSLLAISSSLPEAPPLPATTSLPGPLRSLLAIFSDKRGTLSGSIVNKATIDLMCEVLNLPEQAITASVLKTIAESDVEALLEFLMDLLRNDVLAKSGIRDANRKARRLMLKLINITRGIPRSLFLSEIERDDDRHPIAMGGFAKVFTGKYAGQLVALKLLNLVCHPKENSLHEAFRKEALIWSSISHPFILPFLGVYHEGVFQEKSLLFLVSPFMTNGTLTHWRGKMKPSIDEIHRLMTEVAEAIRYLHAEGFVHGDLHGGNVLLDSQFHPQITDFGLTRHVEATVVHSTKTFVINFAAPELFGICGECGQPESNSRCEAHDAKPGSKTTKTDVYAFGCLYYAIFFDTVPFSGKSKFQIMSFVTDGIRPDRLKNPRMEDDIWNLIQRCWKSKSSERPTMEYVARTLASRMVRGSVAVASSAENIAKGE